MDIKSLKKFIGRLIPTLRIRCIARITLDAELKKIFKKLKPGVVLDIGARNAPYMPMIPHTKYMTLDISRENKPDIVSDAHDIKWKSNYFNTVIATEVLEHCYNPQKVVDEIYRILKKDGACILSTRFIYPYHPDPKDFYRFTNDSLKYLFKKFRKVEVKAHGNKLHSIWGLINQGYLSIILNIFNPLLAKINFKKTKSPCGFVVYARK